MRIALAQIAPQLGNVEANLRLHGKNVRQAVRDGADLLVFPELSLTGYLLQDLVPEVAVRIDDSPIVDQLLRWSRGLDLVVGLVEESEDHRFYNAALYLSRGKIVHRHRKVYLPTYGMFDEGREFAAGESFSAFATRFGRFGILICEDAWHPSASYLLARDGADVLLIVSSGPSRGVDSGRELASLSSWQDLSRVTAQFQTVYVAYVNRVGVEEGMHFSGGSLLVDPSGKITSRAAALKETIVHGTLSREALRRARTRYPLLRDEKPDLVLKALARLGGWSLQETPAAAPPREPIPTRPLARGRLG
ncbi:MAG TPA: nitrilase-related carbon-nitrogen hydrolase [Candidatus Polarisedimenticolia bacterium]|nr:nitrilase-related carbon-nitrogen hydrolase [Candidatus Polarisedimenticolia bacterium]